MNRIAAYLLIFLVSLLCFGVHAQEEEDYFDNNYIRYNNYIYKDSIKTVLIYKEGFVLSYPLVHLNGSDGIHCSFDELGSEVKDYSYTVIHCNSDWKPSGIMETEYIEGMIDDQVTNYSFSFNTFQSYVHYDISIPNDNMELTVSGNYILYVFEDFDREKPVLTKRFCVTEEKLEIEAQLKRANDMDIRDSGHEIDFTINTAGLTISNPFSDIKVVLTQNNRWDNARTDLKPIYIKDEQLIYDHEIGNTFLAGSEFRYFDIKSVRYQSDRIAAIVFERPLYHVRLVDDDVRTFKVYFSQRDLNGKYMPEIQESENNDIDADYVNVYFTLPYDAPIIDGNLYVFGGLSNWTFTKENQMYYNYEKKAYQLCMLLKQGYYNYEYAYVKDGSTEADVAYIEGSHYETECDYLIYVYYRNMSERFDRLVGVEILNSARQ